jgi:DNA-binding MarR family transcriptional regulator
VRLTPKKWEEFQHYKDRAPSWIKLHKRLLVDFAFHRLPVASKALAPMLWLLASEYDEGVIEASLEEIAFRMHMSPNDMAEALNPLIEGGFFNVEQDASNSLADCKQVAIPEIEREKQEKIEVEGAEAPPRSMKKDRARASRIPDGLTANRAAQEAAGLTAAEGDREFTKFRNHAHEKGRTCIDWGAAERNWYLKAAEFMGRKPLAATVPGDAVPNELVVQLYQKNGRWHRDFGPEPGKPGCRVPLDVLQKFGLGN